MIEFGIKDFLDILLVASLLFYVYRLMKAWGSRSTSRRAPPRCLVSG